jgi:hypothetical protein
MKRVQFDETSFKDGPEQTKKLILSEYKLYLKIFKRNKYTSAFKAPDFLTFKVNFSPIIPFFLLIYFSSRFSY